MKAKISNIDGLEYLKTIKSKSIDLILTDPPYQISRDSGMQKSFEDNIGLEKFRIKTQFGDWDTSFSIGDLVPFLEEFKRVLRIGGSLICFYDLWKLSFLSSALESTGFRQLRFIEWIKTNPMPINSKTNYLTGSREIAVCAVVGGKPTFHSEYDNGQYHFPIYQGKKGERIHPTQKSLPLFQELIKKHSNKGDIVLDVFLGSGTTAIAALLEDRNFLGCENDSQYFDAMKGRIITHYPELEIQFDLCCIPAKENLTKKFKK